MVGDSAEKLTAQEQAVKIRELVFGWIDYAPEPTWPWNGLEAKLRAAIEAAMAQAREGEREACAEVAEHIEVQIVGTNCPLRIAAAIRARSTP